MTNDKLYIHEFIDIIGHNRAAYMHHMTANWSPIAQEERDQLCYGVWAVVGTTRGWPQVLNLWEEDGWDGMATSFRLECMAAGAQDPKLAKWWAQAAEFRKGGTDRLLVPAPWTRTIAELCEQGVSGECYAHEQVQLRPGAAEAYLERLRDVGVETHARFGWDLAGAWRTAMVSDDEAFVHWAIPTWEQWAEFEKAQASPAVRAWRSAVDDLVVDWHRFLVVDAPLCPFRTGRQPSRDDRIDYEDL
jgi:hypothetical protein